MAMLRSSLHNLDVWENDARGGVPDDIQPHSAYILTHTVVSSINILEHQLWPAHTKGSEHQNRELAWDYPSYTVHWVISVGHVSNFARFTYQ